jgi:predicted O-methyltransferase YrrM
MRTPVYRPDRNLLSRSVFGALNLRPPASEHSQAEGEMLRRFAVGRRVIVEIGVAEGAGAWEMRSVMAADGTIFLVDPYHLSRFGRYGPAGLIARRLVASATRGEARWITEFSPLPALGWTTPIDFLFIDGNHDYEAVKRDWQEWTRHLAPGGHVALHDSRIEASWTEADWGPVRWLNELREDPEWTVVAGIDSLAVLTPAFQLG